MKTSHQTCLKIRLCGSFYVEYNGARLDEIILHKYRAALLAYLALQPEPHANDHIIHELWPDEETPTPGNLSRLISDMRSAFEAAGWTFQLVSHNRTLWLKPDGLDLDAIALEQAYQQRERAPQDLSEVLERCGLPLLGTSQEGWYGRPWVQRAREKHERLCREAHVWLANHATENGKYDAAVTHLKKLRMRGDYAAQAHYTLMECLFKNQQYITAAQFYSEYRDYLYAQGDRLLLDPRMIDLHARIPRGSLPNVVATPPSTSVQEPIRGAMNLDTTYYIERNADAILHTAIRRHESIICIEGSRESGKTSLLARGLETARMDGTAIISVDFQSLDITDPKSPERLLMAIAHALYERLELPVTPTDHWDPKLMPTVNFDSYVRNRIVRKTEIPVLLAIDSADRIFDRAYRNDIFGMFRSWHNARSIEQRIPWHKFTLVLAYASEAHLLVSDLNLSPFNVATQVRLKDFTQEEIGGLNRCYEEPLRNLDEINRLMAIVGGHPYLVQLCLHRIRNREYDIAKIEAEADQEFGLFGDHMHRMRRLILQDADIVNTVRALISGTPLQDRDTFYRLRSAGVLIGNALREARFRCGLYERHFRRFGL